MEWQELTKKSLESLKQDRLTFWCYIKDVSPIVHPLYRICLVSRVNNHPLLGKYWYILKVTIGKEISDWVSDADMLDFFSHYVIVTQPERLSEKTSKEDAIV